MATFYNQASLTYGGVTVASNTVTGTLAESLAITKTAVLDEYEQNGKITYAVSIVNSSANNYTNLTLTDNLGGYTVAGNDVYPLTFVADSILYFVNGEVTASPTVSSVEPLTLTGVSVPANGSAIIIYEVTANEFAPLSVGGTITNTATLSGAGLEDVTADETVTVVTGANLTILKALNPTTLSDNQQVTYTFTIENSGNQVAAGDVVLADTFDPILQNLAVTYDGTTWAKTINYNYDETSGAFSTIAGQISVPAATITQDVTTGEVTVTNGQVIITVTGTI